MDALERIREINECLRLEMMLGDLPAEDIRARIEEIGALASEAQRALCAQYGVSSAAELRAKLDADIARLEAES